MNGNLSNLAEPDIFCTCRRPTLARLSLETSTGRARRHHPAAKREAYEYRTKPSAREGTLLRDGCVRRGFIRFRRRRQKI
jgi:hypothetical protein